MAQVDFYILPDQQPEQRLLFACRLVEKAYKLGHRVFIHAGDAAQAKAIDELLWGFQPASFVPHEVLEGTAATATSEPVQIGWQESSGGDNHVLINLAPQVPEWFDRFGRVSEIVIQQEAVLQATRNAWRFYQGHGCALQRHDMRR
jgi:DNA polymerase-3 subunit chi